MSDVLKRGKLNVIMDAQAGSSGKGKLAAYIMDKQLDDWDFACNAFFPNAGHWVRLSENPEDCFFYQTLNSCAWMFNRKYNKKVWGKMMFIGPGAIIELPALLREIEENGVTPRNLKISPLAVILQDKDAAFERGEVDFDGNPFKHEGTMKHGSTCHGVGAANARRVLRRSDLVTAADVQSLGEYISENVSAEITDRLSHGQTGILELAQGYQLSILNERFFPHTTSRNVTVAQGLSDMFLPPSVLGNVILNYRTFPIRINSKKYISNIDGRHLTLDEVNSGIPHTVYEGNSGGWYPDQHEISWEQLTEESGSDAPIMEVTSVTKLPRRVATFSTMNLLESIAFNHPPTNSEVFLSINFANYVDAGVVGVRNRADLMYSYKFREWLDTYIPVSVKEKIRFVGTSRFHDDMVEL